MTPDAILDAAGRCFASLGVARTSLGDIAAEAGCSRPTVYRYFEDRDALRLAYVHREAWRVGAETARAVAGIRSPGKRVVEAVVVAVRTVRESPELSAWFAGEDALATLGLARSSQVIEAMVAAFLGEGADAGGSDIRAAAQWVVRVVLSLLAMPAASAREEREILERFVLPGLLGPWPASGSERVGREGVAGRRAR